MRLEIGVGFEPALKKEMTKEENSGKEENIWIKFRFMIFSEQ